MSNSKTPPKMKYRSQAWFDNPANADMTALYIERYLNYGFTQGELQGGKPIIGIAQTMGAQINPEWQILAGHLAFLVVLLPAVKSWTDSVQDASACSAMVRRGGPFACYGPGIGSFVEAARWAGANLPEGSAVLSRKPSIFYVLSGLPSR